VLNSLAEDKLQASVRVLAQHGTFLEIGKFDLSNNSPLGKSIFLWQKYRCCFELVTYPLMFYLHYYLNVNMVKIFNVNLYFCLDENDFKPQL